MSERLKLPAYGKQLLAERRMGKHPLCVHVIFGRDWKAKTQCAWPHLPGPHPLICVHSADYAPGMYDFRCVTGLRVALFDQDALGAECLMNAEGKIDFGRFYDLVGELARHAAGVDIFSVWESRQSADTIAFAWRTLSDRNNPDKNNGWPRWWSEETEREHTRRELAWYRAIDAWLAERTAAAEPAGHR